MKNFRTFDIAVEFYRSVNSLKLTNPLREQLSRAALSITLNLAEGRGKPTTKDQLRFFHIAFGSVRECQAALILANLQDSKSWSLLDSLAASLYRLIQRAV